MVPPAAARIHAPQQLRSRETHERILNAAEALIESHPLDAVTVADIARRAQVSIGNFYKRFATKEAVIEALYARYESQRTAHLDAALAPERWEGSGLDARALGLAVLLVEMFRSRRGVMRAFVLHHRGGLAPRDDSLRARLTALYGAGARLLLGVAAEIRHPRPAEAARFGMLMTASLCRELILFRAPDDPGAVPMSDDRLAAELARMLTGYLRAAPPAVRAKRPGRRRARAPMIRRRAWAVVACLACMPAPAGTAVPRHATPGVRSGRVEIAPVQVDGVAGIVHEMHLRVAENPAAPHGRMLTLTAFVLAATGPRTDADPVLVFQGGPGQGATDLAAFYATFFSRVREHRDIVLMDQRGTGRSAPLMARVEPARMLDDLGAIVPATWVAPTLAALRDSADLTQYTTRRIVDDANAWIAALGYRRVNVYATSYGSRCALDLLRRYPARVRTAVIKNVLPMHGIIPLSYAANAQRALGLLYADVAADSIARIDYPDLRATLDHVLARLDRTPARVRVTNPATGEAQDAVLTRAGVAMALRTMLMTPQGRSEIPWLVERMAADSLGELAAQMVQLRAAYAKTLALGMSLSVVASEECPRMTPETIARDTAGSFLGDAAVASFETACRAWPHAAVERAFFAPVRSNVPALIVSGRMDPATPPAWGAEVARGLPNGVHVVFRFAAHPNSGFAGLDTLVASFIESGTVRGLDLSMAGRGKALPFRRREP